MRVIAKSRHIALATAHGDCMQQVMAWYTIASKAQWHDLSEIRQTFRHADVVGDKTVFNIKGNACRLITHIHYAAGIIYIKDLQNRARKPLLSSGG